MTMSNVCHSLKVDEVPPVSSRSAPDGSNEETKTISEPPATGQYTTTKHGGLVEDVQRDSGPPSRKSPFSDWGRQETSTNVTNTSDHSIINVGSSPFQSQPLHYTPFVPG